jgi:hypothetical protein
MFDRRLFLSASMGLCAFGLSGRAFGQQAPDKAVLYTSNSTEVVQTALGAVGKRLPGLHIDQVTGGTGALMKRLEAEAANPGGDVFWSGGFGTLGAYGKYFEPYTSPEATSIPDALHGQNGLWTGTNVHVMLIMANADQAGRELSQVCLVVAASHCSPAIRRMIFRLIGDRAHGITRLDALDALVVAETIEPECSFRHSQWN